MRWFIAIFCCLIAACHHRPEAYTLARQGRSLLVTPPTSKPEIKNARAHPTRKNGCDIEAESFSVAWKGNTARVTAKPEIYYAPTESPAPQQPTGIAISESGPRIYSDSLKQLETFRDAIAAKEDTGCLRADEVSRLRLAITETFAFPPQIATYLRFGTYTSTGFIDLTPGSLVRVVGRAGADAEVSVYVVAPAADGHREHITLASGPGKDFAIPEKDGFFRYLFRTGASAHNYSATILGASEREALVEATRRFQLDPDGYCDKPPAGVFCKGISAGVNAGFHVLVNGSEVFVRMGGTVSEAVDETRSGVRAVGRREPPQIKSVRRMFHGKLIPMNFASVSHEVLGLILMPGDEITY